MKLCLQCDNTFDRPTWRCPNCGNEPEVKSGFPSFAPKMSSDSGFRDSHFQKLMELEARNFWFRARNELILWALNRYFPSARDFLEIGCGTGFVLSGIADRHPDLHLSGSEISSVGLAHASKRIPGAFFFQMDARAIPFDREFDVIGAFDVLEHIEEDAAVLRQMHRALRPGGGILVTVPQHQMLWSRTDEYACHVRRYAAKDLIAKTSAAGFKVERLTSFVSLLLPLMMAARKWQPVAEKDYDPLAELRIGGLANAILKKFLDIERVAVRAGLSFPAGGSLLLVAKKQNENTFQ